MYVKFVHVQICKILFYNNYSVLPFIVIDLYTGKVLNLYMYKIKDFPVS
jgi:hypothetical protein